VWLETVHLDRQPEAEPFVSTELVVESEVAVDLLGHWRRARSPACGIASTLDWELRTTDAHSIDVKTAA
jgi:hypothetical protein